jgi:hypothetical protein
MSFRNGYKSEPLASFSSLFHQECKLRQTPLKMMLVSAIFRQFGSCFGLFGISG